MKTKSAPPPTHAESFARLGELIKDINIAMLSTVTDDGTIRSRPMGTQQIDLLDGALWFFTSSESPKADEILHRKQVNLSYSSIEKQRYVSISGQAHLVRDRVKAKELWNPAVKIWFPDGVDDPTLVLLRVDVVAAEYWDSPSSKMVQIYGMAKYALTGNKSSELGENVHLDLRSTKSHS
ncbi:MAG TPA: pyridoxamine 5'-phosphate oxidase family protein [Lacunisphaera sp.]|jgi:general stress protein 26